MEMKRIAVFMVMVLTFRNLLVESEVINRRWGDCFKICYNICVTGPIRDRLACWPRCAAECGPKKEIGVKKVKDYVISCSDMSDKNCEGNTN
ncbi:unnamed protein product [Brassica oleracea var. botrytis]|uniref:(rape) hypothetical protein n=1 Tax=Brassica napus TaxID=3708 RepID=A0A816QRB1_BRANA|nr:hypothetical protein HID58_072608 [Brassica napus]CAF2063605.1 unnamed protein product [Brassica napus]